MFEETQKTPFPKSLLPYSILQFLNPRNSPASPTFRKNLKESQVSLPLSPPSVSKLWSLSKDSNSFLRSTTKAVSTAQRQKQDNLLSLRLANARRDRPRTRTKKKLLARYTRKRSTVQAPKPMCKSRSNFTWSKCKVMTTQASHLRSLFTKLKFRLQEAWHLVRNAKGISQVLLQAKFTATLKNSLGKAVLALKRRDSPQEFDRETQRPRQTTLLQLSARVRTWTIISPKPLSLELSETNFKCLQNRQSLMVTVRRSLRVER